jgi:DNA-binding transcriptional LysR family regulator
MVNIELYRIFIAIYRVGTISKAAILCDITQPAASQQLKSLERVLKVKLFKRTPRQMVATDEGHELYTKVSDSFDWLDFVSQDFVLGRKKEKPLFNLGVPMEFYNQVMIGKLKNLPFRLSIHFGTFQELKEKLEKNSIDAMVSTQYLSLPRVQNQHILTENFCLVGSKEIKQPNFDFKNWHHAREWYMKQEWISYDNELSIIRRYFKSLYGLRPNIHPKLIIPNLHSILESIKDTGGVSILPQYLCEESIEKEEIVLLYKPLSVIENRLYLSYEEGVSNRLLVQNLLGVLG